MAYRLTFVNGRPERSLGGLVVWASCCTGTESDIFLQGWKGPCPTWGDAEWITVLYLGRPQVLILGPDHGRKWVSEVGQRISGPQVFKLNPKCVLSDRYLPLGKVR